MVKAFGYLRLSGKGQVDGDGFPRQLQAINAYAAAHDIKIVNVYREKGVSGTVDSANRPAWSDLVTALHSNGVRMVLIEKLDRLARDLMVQETIIADLRNTALNS
jgi:DNA invertase Pin-like site-specific DNA recombinase